MNFPNILNPRIAAFAAIYLTGFAMTSDATTVVGSTVFNSLTDGDLNGQTSTNGSFSVTWTGDGNTDVVAGALETTGVSTIWGDFNSATDAAINASDVVFFSLDMRTNHTGGTNRFGLATAVGGVFGNDTLSIGQRLGGVQTRIGPFTGVADLTASFPGGTTTESEAISDIGWTANTWFTLVGKLTINRTSGAADTLQFWLLSQSTPDFDNLGAASITMNGIDFIKPTTQITGFAFDGNQGGNNFDNFVMAIPEPSCALLGGLGLLTLTRRRRDR